MIYSYSQLKGIIKEGMTVRAVPGKNNGCAALNADGSNIQVITQALEFSFGINGCSHTYTKGAFLEIIDEPKTLESLAEGDVVVNKDGDERTVLGVCGKVYLMSSVNNQNSYANGFTDYEFKTHGYTPKTQPAAETIELFGKKYNKSEVEEAVKGIKEIN